MADNRYTDGTYLKLNPSWGREDAAYKTGFILKLLNRNGIQPEEVIEVGCGAGGILEILARENAIFKLKGYDISPQAIVLANKINSAKINFYEEDILQNDNYHTNLLLVIDVFEHVKDYYSMLGQLRNKSDYFIFHIPLDISWRTILKPHVLLQQREGVGHIHYFSKEMAEWMLKDSGYSIIDWEYSASLSDRGLDVSLKGKIKKILRKLSYAINKNISVKLWGGYSMMILAK